MKKIISYIIILFVGIIVTLPFFRKGYFPTHDGQWAIVRLAEMRREVKDLQFPPRWSDYLNHGYGYPLFNFTYPLPYYLGLILKISGFGFTDAIKTLFVLSVFLSGFFMFLLGKELGGMYAGIIASVMYIVSPFRLVNLYVRGSLGESLSLVFFPLIFYLIIKFILKPSVYKFLACSVSIALLLLTHNVMAMLFFPLIIVFFVIMVSSYYEDILRYSLKYLLPIIILSVGLSSYFLIPALTEKKYLLLSAVRLADVETNFIWLKDFLFSPWSYGSRPSFQLGWVHILTYFIGFTAYFTASAVERKKHIKLAIFLDLVLLILIFMTNAISLFIWKIPPFSWIDFPWRLMTPLMFFISLSAVFMSLHKITRILGIVLIVITVFFGRNFAKPEIYINQPDEYYATNDATTTSMDELMPVWVNKKAENRYTEKVEVKAGKAEISNLIYNSKMISFQAESETDSLISINTIYFPEWKFYSGTKKLDVNYNNPEGKINFIISKGINNIIGKFTDTGVRRISNIVSILSLVLVCGLFLREISLQILKKR